MNNETSDDFMKILKEIESITAVSEEQAATIEEISATMENTNNDIKMISDSIDKIKTLSEDLRKMIEQN